MNERQVKMLQVLMEQDDFISVDYFVDMFEKSERTIRYDLSLLKELLAKNGVKITIKKSKGFKVSLAAKIKIQELLKEVLSYKDDINFDAILSEIFFTLYKTNKDVNIYELMNDLYLSRNTVLKGIEKLKDVINGFKITSNKKGYSLSGDITLIRNYAFEMITKCCDINTLSKISLKDHEKLRSFDVKIFLNIKKVVENANKKHDLWLEETCFYNLLIYAYLISLRPCFDEDHRLINPESNVENNYVHSILSHLKIDSDFENKYLHKIVNDLGIIIADDLSINKEMLKTFNKLAKKANEQCAKKGMRLNQSQFYNDLLSHINVLQNTLMKNVIPQENPLLNQIKNEYADFYEIAKIITDDLKILPNYFIDESEISFIAIYLYKNIINYSQDLIKVIIVCGTGKGVSNLLTARIKNIFKEIQVVGQESAYAVTNINYDCDLIITTVSLQHTSVPTIKVSALLSNKDINNIFDYLYSKKHNEFLERPKNRFDLNHLLNYEESDQVRDLKDYSIAYSKIMLLLLDVISLLPEEYSVKQEDILGLLIHLVIAIPRWFYHDDHNKKYDDLMIVFRNKHYQVYKHFRQFFKEVEDLLGIEVSNKERIGIYNYIVGMEKILSRDEEL